MAQAADKQPWQEVVAEKRRLQAEAIQKFTQSWDSRQKSNGTNFTDILDAGQLLALIRSGEATCQDVMKAYVAKACEVHESSNCFTEVMFDEAIEECAQLDSSSDDEKRPLYGLPVTLKDQFMVRGFDTTLGYVGRSFSPATKDSALVKMLNALGAVCFAKTNLPQSIMWCETENPLWGLTTSPFHKDYTPGGSTGGEAVLLALGASILGWGTDIGGSVRIPSHMMSIYGLKPSSSRLPYRDVQVSTDGQEHVPSSIGPMARTLSTIHLTMKSLINLRPWDFDARCAPIPWREEVYQETLARPLTIGVLYNDGVVRPHPAITRVLESAVETLRAAGHDIVEWDSSLHAECIQVMDQYYTADGCEDIRTDVEAGGEPFVPHVERLVNRGKPISVYQYWQLNKQKFDLQNAYLDKWRSIRSTKTDRNVDILLLPPMPHTAVPHRTCRWVGYTKVWNFLDYPGLVIPGGHVCAEDVTQPWDHPAFGPEDEWNQKLWVDNRETMADLKLPVGLQIVGRKLEEEKVLAAGKVLDDLLRK